MTPKPRICCFRSDVVAGAISVSNCSTIAAGAIESCAGSLRASMLAPLPTEVLGDQALNDLGGAHAASCRSGLVERALQKRQARVAWQVHRESVFVLVLALSGSRHGVGMYCLTGMVSREYLVT